MKSRTFLQREITADMKDNSAWTKNPLEKAKPKETKIDDVYFIDLFIFFERFYYLFYKKKFLSLECC